MTHRSNVQPTARQQPTDPLMQHATPNSQPLLVGGGPIYGGTFRVQSETAPLLETETAPPTEIPNPTLPFVLPNELVHPTPPGDIFPTILTPSPDRVPPPCPHFGLCGGCHYQHATYPAQLALKRQILRDLLADLPQPLPEIQTHAANPWHYRNRIRLRLEPGTSPGTFQIGYNRRASNDLLPIHTCPIATPILLRTALALTTLAQADPNAARWLTVTAELELFTLPDESAVELTLLLRAVPATPTRPKSFPGRPEPLPTPHLPAAFQALCDALKLRIPQLTGATAEPLRPTHANAPVRPTKAALKLPPTIWAKPGLLYPIPSPPATTPTETKTRPSTETAPPTETVSPTETPTRLWVTRNSFFQTNRHLLPDLLATALHAATTPLPETETLSPLTQTVPLAWDLFAGVGLFARALAPCVARITAVESAPTAIADLRAARLPNLEIIESTVLDFLRIAVTSRDRPQLVLLDPPRAGVGLEAAALLTRLAPARIVYVSCDPTTLARDLRPMLSSGYQLAEVHLVDMFPQTFHLETIAVLIRTDPTS